MTPRRPPAAPRGMTLVEMLVATTCTLILMAAVAQVFGAFGSAVSDSRSMIELDSRLRATAWRLRGDLAGATARPVPPLEVEGGEGYLEIIEGPRSDASAGLAGTPLAPADIDDAILLTTRNTETPFIGKYDPTDNAMSKIAESPLAEVGWFLRPTALTPGATPPPVPTYTLFRRQLLVVGYVGFAPFKDNGNAVPFIPWGTFFDRFDLSVQRDRLVDTNGVVLKDLLVPNSLADLTRRENRFAHNPDGRSDLPPSGYRFGGPGEWQAALPSPDKSYVFSPATGSARVSEDVVLTNVIAFDVRVFDPAAPVSVTDTTALVPGDPGLAAPVANGAFVDLGWNRGVAGITATCNYRPRFADLPENRSGLRDSAGPCVWDTWSTHPESNGFNDDLAFGDATVDQGSNGLDDDRDGKVDESPYDADGDGSYAGQFDDPGELETVPPYRFPLRGIEIRIRCYEPSSRQVRQVTVRHSFVPR